MSYMFGSSGSISFNDRPIVDLCHRSKYDIAQILSIFIYTDTFFSYVIVKLYVLYYNYMYITAVKTNNKTWYSGNGVNSEVRYIVCLPRRDS